MVALDIPPGTKEHEAAVTLRRGVTVKGRLTGPNGKPVARAVMLCDFQLPDQPVSNWSYFGIGRRPIVVRDGAFELPGCDPEATFPVCFLDAKNQLGATVTLLGK